MPSLSGFFPPSHKSIELQLLQWLLCRHSNQRAGKKRPTGRKSWNPGVFLISGFCQYGFPPSFSADELLQNFRGEMRAIGLNFLFDLSSNGWKCWSDSLLPYGKSEAQMCL